jgi:mycothiol S-conjugate amidase
VAFDAAGDAGAYPEAGAAWEPLRLFYVTWSARQVRATHDKYLELGLESPFDAERIAGTDAAIAEEDSAPLPPTLVDVTGFTHVRREALLAHRTQIDPTSRWWFGLPAEIQDGLWPYDTYQLARDRSGVGVADGDLFAGLRVHDGERRVG